MVGGIYSDLLAGSVHFKGHSYVGILLLLLSANLILMCLFLPSRYKSGYASWSCIFQITIERKSSLTPNAKGTDGHTFW